MLHCNSLNSLIQKVCAGGLLPSAEAGVVSALGHPPLHTRLPSPHLALCSRSSTPEVTEDDAAYEAVTF